MKLDNVKDIILPLDVINKLLSDNKDSLILLIFYIKTAKIQKTRTIKADTIFCKKGLNWGTKRFQKAKNTLLSYNLVKDVPNKNSSSRFTGFSIQINNLIPNQYTRKPLSGFQPTNSITNNIYTDIDTLTLTLTGSLAATQNWKHWVSRYSKLTKSELALLDTYSFSMNKYSESEISLDELDKLLPHTKETITKAKKSLINKNYIKPITKNRIFIPLLYNANNKPQLNDRRKIEPNNIITAWNKNNISEENLNEELKLKIENVSNYISEDNLIRSIKNYGEIYRIGSYDVPRYSLIHFLEEGLTEKAQEERLGFWQYISFERKVLTLEEWKPMFIRSYRSGLYYGYTFENVSSNYVLLKEAVDRVYLTGFEEKKKGHFLWLEELLTLFKYQRKRLPSTLDTDLYLDIWKEESTKPEIIDFVERKMSNEI